MKRLWIMDVNSAVLAAQEVSSILQDCQMGSDGE